MQHQYGIAGFTTDYLGGQKPPCAGLLRKANTKGKNRQVAQGDVLIESCDPKLIKGLKETRPTVALGEATGHHHSFDPKRAIGFYKEGDGVTMGGGTALADFVKVHKTDSLTHQEHGPIEHKPGTYQRTPQMAWTSEQTRPAAD